MGKLLAIGGSIISVIGLVAGAAPQILDAVSKAQAAGHAVAVAVAAIGALLASFGVGHHLADTAK